LPKKIVISVTPKAGIIVDRYKKLYSLNNVLCGATTKSLTQMHPVDKKIERANEHDLSFCENIPKLRSIKKPG
jgi:hypothetical protein